MNEIAVADDDVDRHRLKPLVLESGSSSTLETKRSRMAEFDRSKDAGVAPTPLLSARMFTFGDAVLMVSEHKPDRGRPLHVTCVSGKRGGSWVETLSYQKAVTGNRGTAKPALASPQNCERICLPLRS